MERIVEMVIELLLLPFRDAPPSRLGESRIEREMKWFWRGVSIVLLIALAIACFLWWR